jgi:hypothetical protein
MTRLSKQARRRAVSPRRPNLPGQKTGPKRDNLPQGYKAHENAVSGEVAKSVFIPVIR